MSRRLTTRRPRWSSRLQTLTLDYGRRCQKSSARNFQLTTDPDGRCTKREAALMFGKMNEGQFCLDFNEVLSPVQAFALALLTAGWK